MILSIVVFLAILGLLIFVHELGHFVVAKLIGVKVEEFGFGFPPRLLKWRRGETVYSVNLVPLGGFVRLAGEFGEEMMGWRQNLKLKTKNEKLDKEDYRTFFSKSVPARLAVIVAGVVMNWLTAVALLAVGFIIGMAPVTLDPAMLGGSQQPLIIAAQIQPGSAAQRAGLEVGDQLIGGRATESAAAPKFQSISDLQAFSRSSRGQEVILTIKSSRTGQIESKTVRLADQQEAPLGVALFETAIIKLPVTQAVGVSLRETWSVTRETVRVFGRAIGQLLEGQVAEEVGGPVLIYSATAQAVKYGIGAVIALASVLSINLALINIVPFPALDGGRALFILLEGIFRKPVIRQRWEQIIHAIGFAMLILLILAITYRDIIRIR